MSKLTLMTKMKKASDFLPKW